MKRLDDIRGSIRIGRSKKRKPVKNKKRPKRTKSLVRRSVRLAKVVRTHNLLNFIKVFKLPVRLVWRYKKILLILIVLILVVGAGVAFMMNRSKEKTVNQEPSRKRELEQVVITDGSKLAVDFIFNLKMTINGQPQAIPANYGKSEDGKFIFNTDTGSGDVNVQSPNREAYMLSDFFALWGSQFSINCLLNHCLGGVGSLIMTVNGKNNPEYNNYIIKEGDQIVLTYSDTQ